MRQISEMCAAYIREEDAKTHNNNRLCVVFPQFEFKLQKRFVYPDTLGPIREQHTKPYLSSFRVHVHAGGLQGNHSKYLKIAATVKHYAFCEPPPRPPLLRLASMYTK